MTTKQIYHKFAAKKYIENGFNMKKTILSLHPEIKEKSAEVKASRLLRNDKFKNELSFILAGITEESVNEKLSELLNAKVITSYRGRARLTNLPDYSERRKTLDMILHLMDAYPSQKIDKRQSGVNLDIVLDKLPPEEIRSMLRELTGKNRNSFG